MMKPFPSNVSARSVSPLSPAGFGLVPGTGARSPRAPRRTQVTEVSRPRRPRRAAGGAGGEGLGQNLDSDVDQDRGDRGGGNPVDEPGNVSQDPAQPDEDSRRDDVAGSGSHLLVSRVADVGRAFDDASAEAGRDRAQAFRREDRARVVLVAGGGRALGVVDSADDRREREWQRDRQIGPREGKAAQEGDARPGDGEMKRRARMNGRGEQGAIKSRRIERPRGGDRGDHQDERPRQAPRQTDPPEERQRG